MIRTARVIDQDVLPATSNLVFAFSWMLVMAIGLMPLAEASLHRSPSITLPTTITFFVAVGSGILLRRRYLSCRWRSSSTRWATRDSLLPHRR